MNARRLRLDLSQPIPLAVLADPLDAAIVLSLYCDARARAEDGVATPRGWWGDALASLPGDRWGSRLWLLQQRGKAVPQTLRDAEYFASEALHWMLEDRVLSALQVRAEQADDEVLRLRLLLDGQPLLLEVNP